MSPAPKCTHCGRGRLRLKHPPQVYECDECQAGTIGPSRLMCVVPHCQRTRGERKGEPAITEDSEWICGEHWRAVPRQLKAIKSRAFRQGRPGAALRRIWNKCKRAAIEAAMGIR